MTPPAGLACATAPPVAAAEEVRTFTEPLPSAGGTAPPRTKRSSSVLPQILACPGTGPGPDGCGAAGSCPTESPSMLSVKSSARPCLMLSLISLELSLVCSLATTAAVSIVSRLLSDVGGASGGPSVEDISLSTDLSIPGGKCSWSSRLQLVFWTSSPGAAVQ